ncbi:MAG TPA: galactose oxidase-like domain-containing protein [Propionibacteriaceae bacterium]|nr:galactose oxidase-like domain-containing protein [Propionibacteriaceae bacterium]
MIRPTKPVLATVAALAMAVSLSPLAVRTADADISSAEVQLKQQQKSLLDQEAPAGTDITSHRAGMHDAPVMRAAARPDSTRVLAAQATSTGGRWSRLASLPKGFNAYHMIMGPGGKILLIAGSGNNSALFKAGTFKAYIWSPTKGVTKTLNTPTDMFCSGHMLMSNGQGLAAGGTAAYSAWKGSKGLYTFDFSSETFKRQRDMTHGRWYPSLINTASGEALITGGFDENGMNSGTTEVYSPTRQSHHKLSGTRRFPLYPHLFLTAKGRYFYTGEGWANEVRDTVIHQPGIWDPMNGNGFTPIPGLTNADQRGSGASCFVGDVRQQNMMVMGGGWPATASTNIVNLNAAKPSYRPGPNLPSPKAYVSCVNLPDGTLLQTNGGTANNTANASREVSLLKSATATAWTSLNPMPAGEHRLYHSMLFLTDDGNLISMGSNPKGQSRSDSVLRFEPPYQFRGTKPLLRSVPSTLAYGKTYTLGVSADVTSVAIDAPQSPTHSANPNMRYLTLPVKAGRVTMSFTANQFPRGYVRLWAKNRKGAISTAKWTKLK